MYKISYLMLPLCFVARASENLDCYPKVTNKQTKFKGILSLQQVGTYSLILLKLKMKRNSKKFILTLYRSKTVLPIIGK